VLNEQLLILQHAITNVTFQIDGSQVNSHVTLQLRLVGERIATILTRQWLTIVVMLLLLLMMMMMMVIIRKWRLLLMMVMVMVITINNTMNHLHVLIERILLREITVTIVALEAFKRGRCGAVI
jgi:hypothetical protein